MSAQQPCALRLAEMLEALGWRSVDGDLRRAAAELRRLHAEVERLRRLVPDVEFAREAIYAKAEGREA